MTGTRESTFAISELNRLIIALARRDYQVIGPVMRDGAIVYDEIQGAEALPAGWTDEQDAGRYRLKRRDDSALFGYAVGPRSWKNYLHPSDIRLWSAERENGVFRILQNPGPQKKYAFVGVRSCDLTAIGVQDRVLLGDRYQDPIYAARRDGVFIVAVQCTHSVSTCFCSSMRTGPHAEIGYDLALTELIDANGHRFLVEVGTEAGFELLMEVEHHEASDEDLRLARASVERAAAMQTRYMDTTNIRDLLYSNLDHPRWDDVAARCLACTNCTLVCPTCFCTTIEDTTDISGNQAERWRRLDSCFTMDFSYIHGGSVRTSHKSRYRQWMTHKLASWLDQFGTSGCVGCGRCITWCPVGIDITEEAAAIRETAKDANT